MIYDIYIQYAHEMEMYMVHISMYTFCAHSIIYYQKIFIYYLLFIFII